SSTPYLIVSSSSFLISSHSPRPPRPTLFPYTTLFRSIAMGFRPAWLKDVPVGVEHLALVQGWHQVGGHQITGAVQAALAQSGVKDRKSTRLNSSHVKISYAVFCLKKKKKKQ